MTSAAESPQFCIAAERSVLGGILELPDILADLTALGLVAEEFSLADHRRLYRALADMRDRGIPLDCTSASEFIGGDPRDVALIADCVYGCVVERQHLLHHAAIVRKKSRLRQLGRLGEWLEAESSSPHADPDSLTRVLIQKLSPEVRP
jgi:replicative DNA helicase